MTAEQQKERFYGLYIGFEVINVKTGKSIKTIFYSELLQCDSTDNDIRLLLTPLSMITDEDAIQVAKIFNLNHLSGAVVGLVSSLIIALDGSGNKSATTEFVCNWHHVIDFLRSRGYALPWMNISVEEQVKRGWIKLKS